MAKFTLELDKRVKLKNDQYNLGVRLGVGKDNIYLKYVPLTVKQYEDVFIKKAPDKKSVEFRERSYQFLSKCEKIFAEMEPFNKSRYRNLVYDKTLKEEEKKPDPLLLTELCKRFVENRTRLKPKTIDLYNTSINSFEAFKAGLTISDITSDFLFAYEKEKLAKGYSKATISSYQTHLRGIINYFLTKEKLIPHDYEYPFGKEGYTIRKYRIDKFVMKNSEIKAVVDFEKFETLQQEYARNIWLLLYRCHGINYADLLRMKWANIKDNHISFYRMKTENTRTVSKELTIVIKPNIQELLDKVGVKDKPYILGFDIEGLSEREFKNKKDWELSKLNNDLKYISEKLNLSIELRIKTARDCFATTLKRAGIAKDVIGEMMGHSNNYISTAHYLEDLDPEDQWKVTDNLF
jgi:site-specific recombinase XerD